MTVSEAITKSGITPSASYTGIETANDFVLAFQIEHPDQGKPVDRLRRPCEGAFRLLNATTEDAQYIRTGNVTERPAPSAPLPSTATAAWAMLFRILC